MFWDKVAGIYDFIETTYNGKVYRALGQKVAEEINAEDLVLECACGTGAISRFIAPKCKALIATDYAVGMLKQTARHCKEFPNIKIKRADLTKLKFRDNCFDKVIAGNVLHLLEDPLAGVKELERVCKPGGKIILPTYINREGSTNRMAIQLLTLAGVDFKRQFNLVTYQQFFETAGYQGAAYSIVDGKMPCAIAVITKRCV